MKTYAPSLDSVARFLAVQDPTQPHLDPIDSLNRVINDHHRSSIPPGQARSDSGADSHHSEGHCHSCRDWKEVASRFSRQIYGSAWQTANAQTHSSHRGNVRKTSLQRVPNVAPAQPFAEVIRSRSTHKKVPPALPSLQSRPCETVLSAQCRRRVFDRIPSCSERTDFHSGKDKLPPRLSYTEAIPSIRG